MAFELFKKPDTKRPCEVCGELCEMISQQKYCDACSTAVTLVKLRKGVRERKKVWDSLSEEEQLRRMNIVSQRLMGEPYVRGRKRRKNRNTI